MSTQFAQIETTALTKADTIKRLLDQYQNRKSRYVTLQNRINSNALEIARYEKENMKLETELSGKYFEDLKESADNLASALGLPPNETASADSSVAPPM